MVLSLSTINQPMAQRLSPLKQMRDRSKLLIHEIYSSIQGESSFMGWPCVFVRTSGCHLRCSYCDTEHAFFKGEEQSIDEVLQKVSQFHISLVELTGGEPLLQKPSFALLDELVRQKYTVLMETSGAVCIKNVNQSVKVILDIKTPASGESGKNVWSNLLLLWPGCEVKFVISNMKDYNFAKEICFRYRLFERTQVLFSPVVAKINPKILSEKILSDKLKVRFQMQLHRILYGESPGK